MTPLRWAVLALAFAIVLYGARARAAHPLDALSGEEIRAAIMALRAANLVDSDTRFPLIDLDEPAKPDVLAWHPGQKFNRSAFVVARRNRTVYEGVVDLGTSAVKRWQEIPGAQSSILADEITAAQQIAIANPEWQAAMRKRGYSTFDKLFCAPFPAGYFADKAEEGHRLLKMVCFDTAGSSNNVWGRPVEGLQAVVDLDERKVVKVVDTGAVPVSHDPADFVGQEPDRIAPKTDGRDLHVAGSEVRWKKWSFHFRMDRRVGPIVSLVRFQDRQRDRLVLYRGSIAEMFVPYMDPDPGWSFRSFMDVGEYGLGALASPLVPGTDCPAGAAFIDATLPDEDGEPVLVTSRMCLFERDTGGPLWRHAEIANRTVTGRPATELVLRSIAALGNYDYVIDWVLTEAGIIRIDVGATGIDLVKGVAAADLAAPPAARDTGYGSLVAPNLAAVNHDHFISVRLDVDIDGPGNTLVRQRLVPQQLGAENGRRSLWRVVDADIAEEGPVNGDHGGGEIWSIVNPNLTNGLGGHPGYELRPGHSVISLLAPDDYPQLRADFSAAPLWVTAYDPRELYAAGPYPNQSRGGDGLPAYAARHRPVANADIVLWYTMGFHHVPRPEDWPVMSTMWHSVSLVPDDFFDRNPALDQRPGDTAK